MRITIYTLREKLYYIDDDVFDLIIFIIFGICIYIYSISSQIMRGGIQYDRFIRNRYATVIPINIV